MKRSQIFLSLFFIPIIITALMLANWQSNRAEWKKELLIEYQKNITHAPSPLPTVVMRLKGDIDAVSGDNNSLFADFELMPIKLSGQFVNDLIFYKPVGDGIELITGFKTSDGIIAVNVGKLPYAAKEISLDKILPQEEIHISGFYRPAENYGDKLPKNKGLVAKIPNASFYKQYKEESLAGAIQVDDKTTISPYLKGRSASYFLENIPNNHIQYMWTWILLAGIATIIYILLLRKK